MGQKDLDKMKEKITPIIWTPLIFHYVFMAMAWYQWYKGNEALMFMASLFSVLFICTYFIIVSINAAKTT